MTDPPLELQQLRAALAATKAELAQAGAVVSSSEAPISALMLEIARLRRDQYGKSSERRARLIDQLELQLEELEAAASENETLAAERLHGDDATVPILARGGTRTGRVWTYVCDDGPFAGTAPPAVLFHFSRDREKVHPNRHLAEWQGILQADAYGGYNDLYRSDRQPGPVASALCRSHARRKFFKLADIAGNVRKGKPAHQISPVALEVVRRIDALFEIGRKSWLFAGSERGGDRAAFIYSLIVTAKLNDIDPQAWLADVLARLPAMPVSRLPELLPWEWGKNRLTAGIAA